jgi:hypothetical protein
LDDIKDITNTEKLVEKLTSIGWKTIESAIKRVATETKDRSMMVIVWKKEKKCCC